MLIKAGDTDRARQSARILRLLSTDLLFEQDGDLVERLLAVVEPDRIEKLRAELARYDEESRRAEAERAAKSAANGPSDEKRWAAKQQADEARWNAILDAGLRERLDTWRAPTEVPDLVTGRWVALDPDDAIVGHGRTAAAAIEEVIAGLMPQYSTGRELCSAFGDDFDFDVAGYLDQYAASLTVAFVSGPAGFESLLDHLVPGREKSRAERAGVGSDVVDDDEQKRQEQIVREARASRPDPEAGMEARKTAGLVGWEERLAGGLRERIANHRPRVTVPDLEVGRWLAISEYGFDGWGTSPEAAIDSSVASFREALTTADQLWESAHDDFTFDPIAAIDRSAACSTLMFVRGPQGFEDLLRKLAGEEGSCPPAVDASPKASSDASPATGRSARWARWLDEGGRDQLATFAEDLPEPVVSGDDVSFFVIDRGGIIMGVGETPRSAFVHASRWFLEMCADPARAAEMETEPPVTSLVALGFVEDLRDFRVIEVRGDAVVVASVGRNLLGVA